MADQPTMPSPAPDATQHDGAWRKPWWGIAPLVVGAFVLIGIVTGAPDEIEDTPVVEEAVTSTEAAQEPEGTEAEPEPEPEPEPSSDMSPSTGAGASGVGQQGSWLVYDVVDGDTVEVRSEDGTTERVRVVGIDTPERGECGFGEATAAMERLVLGKQATLVTGAQDDRDRYDRILRYVDVGSTDSGLELIKAGLAIARYDSRDGHGKHEREDAYVAADKKTEHMCP